MKREGWESAISEVILDPEYQEALDGLEEYSHLMILFWLDRREKGSWMSRVHPKSRQDLPLVGVFATRSQYRPNPIGLTLVKLISRKGTILKVRGLDALNGTPVIDIKPISPKTEFLKNVKVPEWYHRLWKKT